ncbi:zinc finger domain-containing protein [Actinophytocola sediminis]
MSDSVRRTGYVPMRAPHGDLERITAGVDRVVAVLARRRAIAAGMDPGTAVDVADSEAQERRLVRSVPCPWGPCRAQVGRPCTRLGGVPLRGDRVHDLRKQAALGAGSFSHA